MIDRTGVIVARSRSAADHIGKPVRPGFATKLAQDPEGVLHNTSIHEGITATLAYATAARSGFIVALSLPKAEVILPLR